MKRSTKFIIILVLLAASTMTAVAADNHTSKDVIKARVNELMQWNANVHPEMLFTTDMYALNRQATTLPDFNLDYMGFNWDAKFLDVCGEEPGKVIVGDVSVIDNYNARVAMRYVDGDCYDIHYVLRLEWENGKWMLDDIQWLDDPRSDFTERDMIRAYLAETCEMIQNPENVEMVMDGFRLYREYVDGIDDPYNIYHDNPAEVQRTIEGLRNVHRLFRDNPAYSPALGSEIDTIIATIRARAARSGVNVP